MVMTIISLAVGAILFFGFIIGFLRSWKKSLIRALLLLGVAISSVFLSKLLASLIMNKLVSGLVLTIFGFSVDFEKIANDLLSDSEFVSDLLAVDGTTVKVATILMNVVINLLAFLILFLVLALLTLIVYAIIAGIISSKNKKTVGVRKPRIWERFIGGGIGIVASLVVCFGLFTPVFGTINVCDQFSNQTTETTSASAYAVNSNLVAGKLYYTEDEKIGSVETYLQKYDEISSSYKNSFAGKLFKFTGVDAVGKKSFDYLTTASSNGLKVNFTNECVSLIKVYNAYKETFVAKNFDIADNTCVENLQKLYNYAKDSEIAKNYVVELLPKFCEKWANDETYFGINFPVTGDMSEIVKVSLDAFNTTSFDAIDSNLTAMFNVIKVANNSSVIKEYNEGKELIDILAEKDTFVKDEILALSGSAKFRAVLPDMLNELIKISYNLTLGDAGEKFDNVVINKKDINWLNEASYMQDVVGGVLEVYQVTKNNSDSSEMINYLTTIGGVIDSARSLNVVSESLKIFLVDFINSDKFTLSDSAKSPILKAINGDELDPQNNGYWNDANFKFVDLFSTVQETALIAKNLNKNEGTTDLSTIKDALSKIAEKENGDPVKETIKDLLKEDIMGDLLGEDKNSQVFADMVSSFVDNTKSDTIDYDISAGQAIIDIVNSSEENPVVSNQIEADELVEQIANSGAVLKMIDSADETTLTTIRDNLKTGSADSHEMLLIKESIKNSTNLTEEQRTTLSKLFN